MISTAIFLFNKDLQAASKSGKGAGNVEVRGEIEAMRKQNAKNDDDAARFAYLYSGTKTGSNALIEIEIRLLSGDVPSLEEVRAAVDECMKTPNDERNGSRSESDCRAELGR